MTMVEFFHSELEYFLLCITTLFTLLNPLGVAPLIVAMTERFTRKDRIVIARKATITATATLILFALFGTLIFKVYGITVEAFQIMGGIIFFRSGLHMLEARVGRSRTTPREQEESLDKDDIAISPIGIPMITGPGAITAAMLLSDKAAHPTSIIVLVTAILIVLISVYFIVRGGDRLSARMGVTGMRIIQRIMGLILMVIAVQFVINGTQTVLSGIG